MNNTTTTDPVGVPDEVWDATEEVSILVSVDTHGVASPEWIETSEVIASLMGRYARLDTQQYFLGSVTSTMIEGRLRRGLLVNGVSRTGAADAWWFRDEDAAALSGPGVGAASDLLRRLFALPTEPPKDSPGWFWATMWIADALRAGVSGISDLAAWHPAIDPRDMWGLDGDELAQAVADGHRTHAFVTGWGGVQASLADGALSVASIDPAKADWFDVGALARTLAELVPSAHALARAADWDAQTMGWLFDAIGADLWVPGRW